MPRMLVSGANRGLGFELVRQYRAAGWDVVGTVRDLSLAGPLEALGVRVHRFDADDEDSARSLAAELHGVPVDLLIANAGISGDLSLAPSAVTRQEVSNVLGVNTFGPLLLAAAVRPNLMLGGRKIACAMSSLMSSITANDRGTEHVYRASKTALNAVWNALASEWRPAGIACVLLRPGRVKTRINGFQGIEPEVSVTGMRTVIEGLSLADSGRMLGFDGKDVPW